MLTKDLIRYKILKGKFTPSFIRVDNTILLKLASGLVALFSNSAGLSREELLEQSAQIRESSSIGNLVARGLEKLLLDRTEFDTIGDDDLPAFRENIFTESNRLLNSDQPISFESYRSQLEQGNDHSLAVIQERLFGDLPMHQKIIRFKSIQAEKLLHRYNCAQVQGLLIHSSELRVYLPKSRTGSLRQLFKHLRFQQLLATIKRSEAGYEIVIDGPLNLFYQTKKYGLSLALFFPGVLSQPAWRIEADVQMGRRKKGRLTLDERSGLKPYNVRYLDFIPKEIELLKTSFEAETSEWQIRAAEDFYPLPGDKYCFPDFELIHSSGEYFALELFHQWHSSQLKDRLDSLERQPTSNLLIGVATKLAKDKQTESIVKNSNWFNTYGFTFREIPSAKKLKTLLKSLTESRE